MKIVVVSCDKYADSCPAFVELWYKHWPDCPHKMVFVTNKKQIQVTQPVTYLEGPDIAFGWRMRQFIKHNYTDEHLLFMMSDYFVKVLDAKMVGLAHELCAKPDVRHVRLRPMPHPQFPYNVEGFGVIDKRVRYSCSLQGGIWETQVLYDLMRDNENPWAVEINGSKRAAGIEGTFLSTTEPAILHHNYYRKGKAQGCDWVRDNVSEAAWPEACKDVP